jgi:hypothetical protein
MSLFVISGTLNSWTITANPVSIFLEFEQQKSVGYQVNKSFDWRQKNNSRNSRKHKQQQNITSFELALDIIQVRKEQI